MPQGRSRYREVALSMKSMMALPASSHLGFLFFDISEIHSPFQNKSV
jgi:hypothetical protein